MKPRTHDPVCASYSMPVPVPSCYASHHGTEVAPAKFTLLCPAAARLHMQWQSCKNKSPLVQPWLHLGNN